MSNPIAFIVIFFLLNLLSTGQGHNLKGEYKNDSPTLNLVISVSLFLMQSFIISESYVWVPLISDDANKIISSRSSFSAKQVIEKGNMTLILADESMVSIINDVIHEQKGCGEPKTFHSLVEAKEYVSKLENANQAEFDAPTIDNHDAAKMLKDNIRSDRMNVFITTLVGSYKNRYGFLPLSNYGVEAPNWIYDQWAEISSSRDDIEIAKYRHSKYSQESIILTIPGSTKDNEIIVLGAHLDSILDWREYDVHGEMKAPGADDNASGVTVLTEAIRAIVDTGYMPHKTIQFMAYALEERDLTGSDEIAQNYRKEGKNVLGMMNFDMVGYHASPNKVICFGTSPQFTHAGQTDFLKELMKFYFADIPYAEDDCQYRCSDHASWTEADYPASYAHECKISPHWHKESDVVENVDVNQMSHFAQLAVVYIAEMAKGKIDLSISPANLKTI